LRGELPGILATHSDVLSPRMLRIVEDLAADWRRLDEHVESLSGEIAMVARQDKGCEQLMTVPGIGPIISSTMVAAAGTGDVFSKGPTSAPGLAWCRNRYRPVTAQSSAAYRGGQSLSTQSVCSGRLDRVGQGRAKALGPLWAQVAGNGRGLPPTPDILSGLTSTLTFLVWRSSRKSSGGLKSSFRRMAGLWHDV
jgi:transposase